MKTIAENMRDIMQERGMKVVWYGSIDEIHECAQRSGLYQRVKSDYGSHALNIINKILKGLGRSPLFEKSYIKYVGRPARAFKLKNQ